MDVMYTFIISIESFSIKVSSKVGMDLMFNFGLLLSLSLLLLLVKYLTFCNSYIFSAKNNTGNSTEVTTLRFEQKIVV